MQTKKQRLEQLGKELDRLADIAHDETLDVEIREEAEIAWQDQRNIYNYEQRSIKEKGQKNDVKRRSFTRVN